ncbi:MAG: PP2C family protein-serine/threonine phosphatase, partial [Candidatus Poribacteria bacterium]
YFMGIDEKLDCRTNIIKWGDGDILVLYTDGITETLNSQDEQFGKERLERLISSNTNLSAPELKSLIIQELNKYCEDNVYKDDVTLVIAKMGY